MNIYEKLLVIQQKLKVPKSQYNSFSEFYYRNCEDILEAAKPLCNEVKAVLLLGDEVKEVGGRVYVMAEALLVNTEKPEESIRCYGYARETESRAKFDAAQLTGAASSYARKYALSGLFDLDDNKDADNLRPAENAKAAPKEEKTAAVTAKQVADLQALAKQKGVNIESIVNGYKLKTLQDISPQQWAQAMNGLQKRADV